MKKTKTIDAEKFINELKLQLSSLADAWGETARKFPNKQSGDWISSATTGSVLYSLSQALRMTMDEMEQKKKK